VGEQALREVRRRDPDGDVDEEDPVPVQGRREDAAGEEADRGARRRDEREDPDRLGLLVGPREERDDHAEDDGRGQRPADALDEARGDEHVLALGRAAEQRRQREQCEAAEEDPLAADEVTQAPGQEQQSAERDEVGVHDPGEARLGEAEVLLDRRQRDVHDRLVEDDHQHPRAEDDQRDPAVAVARGVAVGDGGGGAWAGHRSGPFRWPGTGRTVADRLVQDDLVRTDCSSSHATNAIVRMSRMRLSRMRPIRC